MTNETKEALYAKARVALLRIEDGEAKQLKVSKQVEAWKWQVAEAMAKLSDMGETYRVIARELDCSTATVTRHIAVWRASGCNTPRPSFSEALAQVPSYQRTDQRRQERTVPIEPDAKAAFVAKLLEDKAVADAPEVIAVQERHSDRRLRQETAEWNRQHDIPTRTEVKREERRLSVVENSMYWRDLIAAMGATTRLVNDGVGEIERTGMPQSHAGDMIKAARSLERAAKRLNEATREAAIGMAMTPTPTLHVSDS